MTTDAESLEPTRRSLIIRLKNLEDQTSWQHFFNKYWKLIYTMAIRSGLTEVEAQETVQETVIRLVKSIQSYRYQPEQCSFRSWLLLLTRQRIIEQIRKRKFHRHDNESLNSIDTMPDPTMDQENIWNEEWEKNLITLATEQVQQQVDAKQFQIFDLYVLQDWPVKQVTETLRVSTAQVYLAKHRVGRLMKKVLKDLVDKEDFAS